MTTEPMVEALIRFVREQYRTNDAVPLHAPVFAGRERQYVMEAIDSTFVSSVGIYVNRFEQEMAVYTGSPRAVATVNGTAALQVALLLAGVRPGDLVITQPLTFVATCNAITYCNAEPVFVDVERHTLGLAPQAVSRWLAEAAYLDDKGVCRTKADQRIVRACLPMHTFGHPADLDGLVRTCKEWNLTLVEDAAESLGSFYKGRHTGTIGELGALSFNGNKILTTGGGGMILANAELGARAKFLTTTAKREHPYEFVHDEIGFNYRLPNLNAALGIGQLERLDDFITAKRALAGRYERFFEGSEFRFVKEPAGCRSNYWLNAIVCDSFERRDEVLKTTNVRGVMTRPIWRLMHRLPAFERCRRAELPVAEELEARVVTIPSSVPVSELGA